jgi:hypothetical protein
MVYFATVRLSSFADVDDSTDPGAPHEAFFAATVDAFRATARALERRPPAVLAAMRERGLSLRLFVELRMDQDQMELSLPPELLLACGQHDLEIHIISNDISVAEALAAGCT